MEHKFLSYSRLNTNEAGLLGESLVNFQSLEQLMKIAKEAQGQLGLLFQGDAPLARMANFFSTTSSGVAEAVFHNRAKAFLSLESDSVVMQHLLENKTKFI